MLKQSSRWVHQPINWSKLRSQPINRHRQKLWQRLFFFFTTVFLRSSFTGAIELSLSYITILVWMSNLIFSTGPTSGHDRQVGNGQKSRQNFSEFFATIFHFSTTLFFSLELNISYIKMPVSISTSTSVMSEVQISTDELEMDKNRGNSLFFCFFILHCLFVYSFFLFFLSPLLFLFFLFPSSTEKWPKGSHVYFPLNPTLNHIHKMLTDFHPTSTLKKSKLMPIV